MKLYFTSAAKTENDILKYASEVVVARNDEWAIKLSSKQNSEFEKDTWKIDAAYSVEDIKDLLNTEQVIVKLGISY